MRSLGIVININKGGKLLKPKENTFKLLNTISKHEKYIKNEKYI